MAICESASWVVKVSRESCERYGRYQNLPKEVLAMPYYWFAKHCLLDLGYLPSPQPITVKKKLPNSEATAALAMGLRSKRQISFKILKFSVSFSEGSEVTLPPRVGVSSRLQLCLSLSQLWFAFHYILNNRVLNASRVKTWGNS